MHNRDDEKVAHLEFMPCEVIRREGRNNFIWKLSDITKDKIRGILKSPDLKFGFDATLEEVPPFSCPECGTEVTFFDLVRDGINAAGASDHSREFMVKNLQKKEIIGNGIEHSIHCEKGHKQPIVMGWAIGFGWTYSY